jgi:hypothetical protein
MLLEDLSPCGVLKLLSSPVFFLVQIAFVEASSHLKEVSLSSAMAETSLLKGCFLRSGDQSVKELLVTTLIAAAVRSLLKAEPTH